MFIDDVLLHEEKVVFEALLQWWGQFQRKNRAVGDLGQLVHCRFLSVLHLEIQHSFLLEGDFDVDIGIFDGGLVEGYLFSSG